MLLGLEHVLFDHVLGVLHLLPFLQLDQTFLLDVVITMKVCFEGDVPGNLQHFCRVLRILNKLLILMKRQGVLKLLCEILVDGLATLQDGSSILEALDLLEYQAGGINFVFAGAINGDDALTGIPL